MIKQLMMGASALAMLSAAPAMAQEAGEVDIRSTDTRPFAPEQNYENQFRDRNENTENQLRRDNFTENSAASVASRVDTAETIIENRVRGSNLSDPASHSSNNSAAIDQDGRNADADIDQGANANNWAAVKQNVEAGASTNNGARADIDQDGTGSGRNVAYIQQLSVENANGGLDASIDQTNTGSFANYATVLQGQPRARGTQADIVQDGSGNDAVISQANLPEDTLGSSRDAAATASYDEALITQHGVGNRAAVQQEDWAGFDPSTRLADTIVDQDGDSHEAYVLQVNGSTAGQFAFVTQQNAPLGTGNFAAILQNGEGGMSSDLFQNGDGNEAFVRQELSSGNGLSTVRQDGNDNYAELSQFASASSVIDQDGLGDNTAVVVQTGLAVGADSSVFQSGQDLTAFVHQNTAGAMADISQSGTSNIASITQ